MVERDYLSEIVFWKDYLADPTGTFDAEARRAAFPEFLLSFLEPLHTARRGPVRLLELGSGPVSLLAWGVDTGLLDVIAVDPLAKKYERLMQRHGFDYPIRPIEGTGERLLEVVSPVDFDAAYSSNALDHAVAPLECMRNMVRVVRPGGFICLEGLEREGSSGDWEGLHQHDLIACDGYLLHVDRFGNEANLTASLDLRCVFESVGDFAQRGFASHGYEYDDSADVPNAWHQRRWYSMVFEVGGGLRSGSAA